MQRADIPAFGWLVVVSGILSLFSFVSPGPMSALIGPFALRHDIAWMLVLAKFAIPFSPRYVIVLWTIVVIGCGFGILNYSNIMRIIFVFQCVIQATLSLVYILQRWEAVVANLKFIRITPPGTLLEAFRTLGPLVIALAYGVYLSLPKVKDQFE